MRLCFKSLLVIGAALLPTAALAVNWMYLTNQPGPFLVMSDPDRELFQKTAREALEQVPDGGSLSWKSPINDTFGVVHALSTFSRDGMRCRKMRFETSANNVTGQSEHTLCKTADGSWAFAN